MLPFWILLKFLAQTNALALGITAAIRYHLGRALLGSHIADWLVANFIVSSVILLDAAVIYPRLRSPLRRLPRVSGGYSGRLFVEKPRGKTPLSWAIRRPDADLINSRGKFGESILLPVSPTALRDVMNTNAYDFVKPSGLRFFLSKFIGWGLITVEGSAHKSQRRSLTPSFNIRHIRGLYTTMWEKSSLLAACLKAAAKEAEIEGKQAVDITPWVSRYALDIIGRAALSRGFNALVMRDYHPVARSFAKLLEPDREQMMYLIRCFVLPTWLVEKFSGKAKAGFERDGKVLRDAAIELYQAEKMKPKMVVDSADMQESTILGSIIRDTSLTQTEVIDTILTIIGAGHETSAASVSWACYLLGLPENRHYQEMLREEVRANFPGSGEPVDPAMLQAALETSPWLHGVCEEVLRLFPTVPVTMREAIRETTIAGCVIPKDTLVMICPWAINRNPRYWGEDAASFRPERWLDAMPDGRYRLNKNGGAVSNYCEMTFLHGPRACIGRDFAKAELKCALAGIFGKFEMSVTDAVRKKLRISGQVTIKPEGGLPVRLTPIVEA